MAVSLKKDLTLLVEVSRGRVKQQLECNRHFMKQHFLTVGQKVVTACQAGCAHNTDGERYLSMFEGALSVCIVDCSVARFSLVKFSAFTQCFSWTKSHMYK